MTDQERIEAMEARIEALERTVRSLDARTVGQIRLGPGRRVDVHHHLESELLKITRVRKE